MRYQDANGEGELMSSAYVQKDKEQVDASTWYPEGPSLTRQEFVDECDVNQIMARYETTGQAPPMNAGTPQYLDLSDVPDLQTALEFAKTAQEAFMRLPAAARREFDNDPVKFVQYAENPDNLEQMRKWGLAEPAPVDPPPQKVEIVNPEPPPAAK